MTLGEEIKNKCKEILDVIQKNKILDATAKTGLYQIPILGNFLVELYDEAKNKETATATIITLLERFQTETDEKLRLIYTLTEKNKELLLKVTNDNQTSLDLFLMLMKKLDAIETAGELTFFDTKENSIKLDMILASNTQLSEKIEKLKSEHIQKFNDEQTFDTSPNKEFLKQAEEIKAKIVSEFETPGNNTTIMSLDKSNDATYVPQRCIHLRTKKEEENVIKYSLNLIEKYSKSLETRKKLGGDILNLQNTIEKTRLSDRFLKRRRKMDEKNLSKIERKFGDKLSNDNKKNIQSILDARKKIAVKCHSIEELRRENIIPIVGDYGSGKTFFSLKIAYELSKHNDSAIFYIPLGELNKHNDLDDHLKEDIFNYAKKKYELRISLETFIEEITRGKIIFILDALDELSRELDQKVSQTHLQHVIELSKKCVVVLTGRHTYLTDHMEQLFKHDALIKLLDFNKTQIRTFLHRVLSSNQLKIEEIMRVVNDKKIETLATKPLFLFVIYKHFDKLNKYPIINEAVILRTLTEEWIRHDVIKQNLSSEKESKRIEERQRISEVLAFRYYSEGQLISLNSIKEEVAQELLYDATQSLEQYYNDAVNSTFLVKESNDRFGFIVKPIAEYLVASRILEDVKKRKPILAKHASEITNKETMDFLLGLIEVQWAIEPFVLEEIKSSECYEKIKEFKNYRSELLDRIVNEETGTNVGNLFALLLKSGNLHSKYDLKNLVLDGMDAPTTNLSKSKLTDSKLNLANLSGCDLSDADFSNTALKYVEFRGANLTNANFSGTTMNGATLSGANITNTNFSKARFHNITAKEVIFREDPILKDIELVEQDDELADTAKLKRIKCRIDPNLWKLIIQSNPKYNFSRKRKKKK